MNSTSRPRFIASSDATGESMPPESNATARPLVPTGSPPAPCELAHVHVGAVRVELDAQLQVGPGEVDRERRALLDRGADQPLDLLRREVERLVPAAHPDREGARLRAGEGHHADLGDALGVTFATQAYRACDKSEHPLQAGGRLRRNQLIGHRDQEHRPAALDTGIQATQRGAGVAAQRIEEMPLVAALQRRLADLCEQADGSTGGGVRNPVQSGVGALRSPVVPLLRKHARRGGVSVRTSCPRRLLR